MVFLQFKKEKAEVMSAVSHVNTNNIHKLFVGNFQVNSK